jgi:hypothetical protein
MTMGKIWVLLLVAGLFAVPAAGQNIFVKGNGQAATAAKAGIRQYTYYNLSDSAHNLILEVRQETWSRTFLGPRTTAISMKLMSGKGRLLWSKIEPVGSRSEGVVVQDLLKDLARSKVKSG